MFNFTTQSVYNNIATAGPNKNMYIVADLSEKPRIRIGNTRFDAEDILDIQVKAPTIESLAYVTFDMTKALIPDDSEDKERTARFVLYIGLSMNDQSAFYANEFVYKGKPLFVEFSIKKDDTAEKLAKRVKTVADKYLLLMMGQEKILDISYDGGNVTFTGVNGYQQIKKANLQVFDPDAKTVDCCSTQGEYVDLVKGVPVTYTLNMTPTAPGTVVLGTQKLTSEGLADLEDDEVAIAPGLEAFGDYNWILHNLRLPTAANYYPWSPANRMGENPIPGQVYTQFIIRMIKQRDGIMGEIVGARGTSVTTHVLYVAGDFRKSGTAANNVMNGLSSVAGGRTKFDADSLLGNPYHTSVTNP